jgi:O-antigen/teichoic acid export membrane protein
MSLKQKTVSGVIWSFIGYVANQGINFIIGIVLARLLSPTEFGLLGELAIFLLISELFINSGFSQALIRKNDCTEVDYSTVFYFNVFLSSFIYIILFFIAPLVTNFYKEPLLTDLLRVLGIGLIATSISLIQRVKLTKSLNFKYLNGVSTISNIISGILAVILAMKGFGVWSLVIKTVSRDVICTIGYWIYGKWKPLFIFSRNSFKELFGFGSKLLLSGITGTIINNIQYIIIGKFFSAKELGFYTRAELFKNLPSQNIEGIMTAVGYPVLANVQNDKEKLNHGFKQLFLTTTFAVFFTMLAVASCSQSIILAFVGDKWSNSIIYLQMLSVIGIMYPLLSININLVSIVGRSDIYFKFQLISQIMSIPIIAISALWGIKAMICGMILNSFFDYYLYTRASSKFIDYTILKQLKDIFPILLIMLTSWGIAFIIGNFLQFASIVNLSIQALIGSFLTVLICEISKQRDYTYIKQIILEKIKK